MARLSGPVWPGKYNTGKGSGGSMPGVISRGINARGHFEGEPIETPLPPSLKS